MSLKTGLYQTRQPPLVLTSEAAFSLNRLLFRGEVDENRSRREREGRSFKECSHRVARGKDSKELSSVMKGE